MILEEMAWNTLCCSGLRGETTDHSKNRDDLERKQGALILRVELC